MRAAREATVEKRKGLDGVGGRTQTGWEEGPLGQGGLLVDGFGCSLLLQNLTPDIVSILTIFDTILCLHVQVEMWAYFLKGNGMYECVRVYVLFKRR